MPRISRRASIGILCLGVLSFLAIGPGLDWWRRRRTVAVLRPIVERFRAMGADLHIQRSTRGGADWFLRGTVADEPMREQLRTALREVVEDENEVVRLTKNVKTKDEIEPSQR